MITRATVNPADAATLTGLRSAVADLATALDRHLEAISRLPAGATSFAALAELNLPVHRALRRWDQAVFEHTGTFPVGVDDPGDDPSPR